VLGRPRKGATLLKNCNLTTYAVVY